MTEQQQRSRKLIERLTEEQLSGQMPGNVDRTVRYAVLHGLHDEAYHSGEIWLLRKLLRSW